MSSGKCHYWSLPDGIHSNSVGTKAVSRKTWAKRRSAWQPSPALPWHRGSHLRLPMGASGEGGLFPPLPARLPQQGAEHSLQVLEAQARPTSTRRDSGDPRGSRLWGSGFLSTGTSDRASSSRIGLQSFAQALVETQPESAGRSWLPRLVRRVHSFSSY